jgi:hypothetical protein
MPKRVREKLNASLTRPLICGHHFELSIIVLNWQHLHVKPLQHFYSRIYCQSPEALPIIGALLPAIETVQARDSLPFLSITTTVPSRHETRRIRSIPRTSLPPVDDTYFSRVIALWSTVLSGRARADLADQSRKLKRA